MNSNNINDMNLYKKNNRFLTNYVHLKKRLKRKPSISELSSIDHLHYDGTNAVDNAIEYINIKKNSFVLDIGSGIGGPARYIAHKTKAIVYAVEIQQELNDIANLLTKEYNLSDKVKHIKNDINNFLPVNVKFDHVVSWLALYHVPNRKKLLDKIYSLLKSSGYFYSEDFFIKKKLTTRENNHLAKDFYANHLVEYSEYLNELKSNNFNIIVHRDLSKKWCIFTKKRLSTFINNIEEHSKLHGKLTTKYVLNFYKLAYELLSTNKIGGISFVCKK
mgnify:CR=1 FL=1